jgi:hypothetical protein
MKPKAPSPKRSHRGKVSTPQPVSEADKYQGLLGGISALVDAARNASVRSVDTIMTATYWDLGRRIVEYEQGGKKRAEYGVALLQRLSLDLTGRHGRGFSVDNLQNMRLFYLSFPPAKIYETLSRNSFPCTQSGEQKYEAASRQLDDIQKPPGISPGRQFHLVELARSFPLSWSHYVLLLRARSAEARTFYEEEALRGGWQWWNKNDRRQRHRDPSFV